MTPTEAKAAYPKIAKLLHATSMPYEEIALRVGAGVTRQRIYQINKTLGRYGRPAKSALVAQRLEKARRRYWKLEG